METNRLKRFASEARNILMNGVKQRLAALGFQPDGSLSTELPELMGGGSVFMGEVQSEDFYHKWMSLYQRIQSHSYREVVEETAYTWFNRLMAIRIMVKNELVPPVLEYESDEVRIPLIVSEARQRRFPQMNDESRQKLEALLNNDALTDEQFAVLIVAYCHGNPIINKCFGTISDYTELLLPSNILAKDGFVDKLNADEYITDEDYRSPELIGWLYQFYISERKDEVFAKKGKFEADEIPAATQIFTPNWIVKYMVQNTVGRIYLDNNPYTDIKEGMKYLVEPTEPTPADAIYRFEDIHDLTCADLACGSGHILNECFDLLYQIYIEEGYNRKKAVEDIFRYNLTGIDIDARAKQLAIFALLMKACQKDVSFADAHCMPRVLDMPVSFAEAIGKTFDSPLSERAFIMSALKEFVMGGNVEMLDELTDAIQLMNDAQTLGSIMKFNISDRTRNVIAVRTAEYEQQEVVPETIQKILPYIRIILALTQNYAALVMNPPYMGANHMKDKQLEYVKNNFKHTSNDLGAIFMDVAYSLICNNGKIGMINQAAWFFKPAYKEYRKHILNEQCYNLDNALYLGPNTFPELKGEVVQSVSFVFSKSYKRNTHFFYLKKGVTSQQKCNMFLKKTCKIFQQSILEFFQFEGCQFGFWINKEVQTTFKTSPICKFGDARQGLKTGDNNYFIKQWFEVSNQKLGVKWFPVETGGNYRKWYGNGMTVLNWENDGYEIKNFKNEKGKLRSRPQGLQYSFKTGITWSTSAGDKPSFRYSDSRYLFESSGSKFFLYDENGPLFQYCAYFNSYAVKLFIEMLSPGLGISEGAIKALPYIFPTEDCNLLAENNIEISRSDWDAHETSWDFHTNELVALDTVNKTDMAFNFHEGADCNKDIESPQLYSLEYRTSIYKQKWEDKFNRLHANEEELNRQFIEIYGLQDELTPDVPLKEVTILQQGEISIEGNKLQWHDDVLMKQLISYAVGCMMGRYSIDRPGLILANQGDGQKEYETLVPNSRFAIDDDGIIPLMSSDTEFTDNITLRFKTWLGITFGEESLVENLNFIERSLGKRLDDYFVKDFWKDHKKMYQNRPIYWLFTSKKGAFQCIAYMHRMNAYTAEKIRTNYLLPHIEWLLNKQSEMQANAANLSIRERKELDSIGKQIDECREYHDRLHVVADRQIGFDLDDGVLVNYAKFGDVLAKLK